MNRREFSVQLFGAGAVAGLGLTVGEAAQAQTKFVEGTHYAALSEPLPVPKGKIDVVEFFSYACPHCNEFEPVLEAWVKKVPADVNFHRVPVPFLANRENFQRLYYALESMGQVDKMQTKVFHAVHIEGQSLDKPADIQALMVKNGIDGTKFLEVFNSFSVQIKTRQAKQWMENYKIDGVPTLGIQGRYRVSGTMAGSNERMLAVTDYLIQRVRGGA